MVLGDKKRNQEKNICENINIRLLIDFFYYFYNSQNPIFVL